MLYIIIWLLVLLYIIIWLLVLLYIITNLLTNNQFADKDLKKCREWDYYVFSQSRLYDFAPCRSGYWHGLRLLQYTFALFE